MKKHIIMLVAVMLYFLKYQHDTVLDRKYSKEICLDMKMIIYSSFILSHCEFFFDDYNEPELFICIVNKKE